LGCNCRDGSRSNKKSSARIYGIPRSVASTVDEDKADFDAAWKGRYAVSFQAHPEYASTRERELGVHGTLELSLDKMGKRGELDREGRLSIGRDAQEHFETVQREAFI
jgi:hypothetical protein